jgi:hypothetical protein
MAPAKSAKPKDIVTGGVLQVYLSFIRFIVVAEATLKLFTVLRSGNCWNAL